MFAIFFSQLVREAVYQDEMRSIDKVFILGAGFSAAAKLPLQKHFSDLLISDQFSGKIDLRISAAIQEFLERCFFWRREHALPSLEDIFTMIDLSAATGHNLGIKFPAKKLRALRRMLIYRVFQIIDKSFSISPDILTVLKSAFSEYKDNNLAFIVLNWDIVLERHLEIAAPNRGIDYCISYQEWSDVQAYSPTLTDAPIAKVHGSSNWVYCDNCRSLFADRYSKLSKEIGAGLIKSDFRLFDSGLGEATFDDAVGLNSTSQRCPRCGSALGPHIATFSFRKSFRTHAFASSWLGAEQMLSGSREWVFIGYSLPDADYEFKHMLKTAQLKYAHKKGRKLKITAVLRDDPRAGERFRTIFGASRVELEQGGISGYAETA